LQANKEQNEKEIQELLFQISNQNKPPQKLDDYFNLNEKATFVPKEKKKFMKVINNQTIS